MYRIPCVSLVSLGLGRGNYTEERRALFANLTLEEFEAGVAALRAANTTN